MRFTYKKGVRFERELLHFLNSRGFAVSRTASSGSYLYPVDIIAMKNSLSLAFECKSHSNKPKIARHRLRDFKEWCKRAGALGFLAWRAPKNRWLFLRIEDAEANRYEDENWLELESLLSALNIK